MEDQTMDFSIKSADSKNSLNTIKTDCIVVGVYEDKKLTSEAAELDNQGIISNALKNGDIDGKPGSSLLLREPSTVTIRRILLVGLGKKPEISEKNFRQAIDAAIKCAFPDDGCPFTDLRCP